MLKVVDIESHNRPQPELRVVEVGKLLLVPQTGKERDNLWFAITEVSFDPMFQQPAEAFACQPGV